MSDTCEFCDKLGLPVLPVRYAVAPDNAKAPKIAAPFAVKDLGNKDIPIGGKAHYTARLLRSGYLYVYDEARKRWSAYYVTPDAYYMRFNFDRPMPKEYVGRVPCNRSGHPEVASMITISDPKNATNVWFGFSDVEWTPATKALHVDPAYRARHMQKLDVKTALTGATQPHAQKISKLGEVVAEYNIDPIHASKVFFDSPFAYRPRKLQLQQMIDKADALRKDRGVVLVVNDPAGVATELAALMQERMAVFLSRAEIQRPLKVAGSIAGLEESIKSAARAKTMTSIESYADMIEAGPAATNPNAMLAGIDGDPEEAQKWRDMLTPETLKKAEDDEWKQYTHHMRRANQPSRFDDAARKKWQAQFDAELNTFDWEQIAPLAQSHAAWMRSDCMAGYFECNFDDADSKSGVAYAATFKMCIDQTADKKACFDLYEEWLKGDATDKRRLALRALGLNQEDLAKKVKESLSAGVDWRVLPNDDVFTAFGALLARLPTTTAGVLGGLLDQLGGVLVKIAQGVTSGNAPGLQAIAVMGGAGGRQVARLPVMGSKKKFVEHYVRELSRLGGPKVSEHQLRRAAAAQVRLLGYEGMRLEGSERRHWLVALDRNVLKGIPPNASGQAWANAAAKAIHSPETLRKADAQAWRSFMGTNVPASLVVGIVQVATLGKLMADYTSAMGHEAKDAKRRMMAGIVAFAGTLGELAGAALEKMAQKALTNARGLRLAAFLFRAGGRLLGTIAAFVTGALDWEQGKEAAKKQDHGLAKLYYASAFLGMAVGVALLLKFTPLLIIFALVAAFVLVTYLIEKNKDNKLQEWLARCYFNVSPQQRYSDFEIEQKELDLALKG